MKTGNKALVLSAATAAITAGAGLTGCAVPYSDRAQAAYRVDPVMVQWEQRGRASAYGQKTPSTPNCPRPPDINTTGNANTNDAVDVLCPIDLDVYVFPQDRQTPNATPAYVRLLACQERVAPFEFTASLARDIESLNRRIEDLTQKKNVTWPQRIASEKIVLDGLLKTSGELAEKAKAAQQEADKAAGGDKQKADDARQKAAEALAAADAKKKEAEAQAKKLEGLKVELDQIDTDIATTRTIADSQTKLREALGDTKLAAAPAAPTLGSAQDEALCMTLRNQLQDELIKRSTIMCEKHLSDVKATASVFNATLGFASLAQSTVASIVTGQTAARILAAGASVATGTQAVLNKEVYRDFVVPAITRAINQERTRRHNLMQANRLRPLMEYSAGQAMTDVAAYHETCSFSNGLELIGNDAEKRVEPSIPDLEARIKALAEQIKLIDGTLTDKASEAEKKAAERSKVRLRNEMEVLQARLSTARQNPSK